MHTSSAQHPSTDVWAFGVTMWEILNRGEMPYFQFSRDDDVIAHVLRGGRLERPEGCPDVLWSIIERCWAASPTERPSFAEIGEGKWNNCHRKSVKRDE
jgi:serine/threonine protein kinase